MREHVLPPRISLTATAGLGISRIQLFVDSSEPAAAGFALLAKLTPEIVRLDHLAREQEVAARGR